MKGVVDLVGRILMAFIFIYEGIDSILYFGKTRDTMIDYGITWQTDMFLVGTIVLLMVGGTLLMLGYRSSVGAILLLLYWIPFTLIVYSWWDEPEPQRRLEAIMFMRNLAIAGGLLMIYVNGSGKYSVRTLLANTKVPKKYR